VLFVGSHLKNADNSGAKLMKMLRVIGNSFKESARLGEMIRVSVSKVEANKKVVRKKLYSALILTLKSKTRRKDGSWISYSDNCAALISEQDKFLGTRVLVPVCKEVRGGKNETQFKKIISSSGRTL